MARLEVGVLAAQGFDGFINAELYIPAHPEPGESAEDVTPLGYTCADGETPINAVRAVLDWHRELYPECRCTEEIEERYAGIEGDTGC